MAGGATARRAAHGETAIHVRKPERQPARRRGSYGTSNSKTHVNRNYPLLVAGGSNLGIKHCGYHNFLETGKQPLCNLYLTFLQSLGVPAQSFSDSTGTMKEILT